MSFCKPEIETQINWSNASELANVYTRHKSVQRRIEEVLKIKPISIESDGTKEYEIDKKLILIRKPRKISSEQREKLKQIGFKSKKSIPICS